MEPKPAVSATYSGVPTTEFVSQQTNPKMKGRYREIFSSFFLMTVPMIAFSGLLLGLIFYYRVVPNKSASPNLELSNQQFNDYLLVRLSSTTLITVASWSSTIAPILVGVALTLISYPVAKSLMDAVMDNNQEGLPTPYQLGLMLRMVTTSGPGTFWFWLQYTLGWKSSVEKQKQPKPLKAMVSIMSLGLLLSLLVFATDTWLHFTTKTINFTQVYPTSVQFNASYTLKEACYDVKTPWATGCTIDPILALAFNLDGRNALQLLYNTSETMAIKSHEVDGEIYSYYGVATQPKLANIDYTASTWGLKSKCKAVTPQCADESRFYGTGSPFNCQFPFQGFLPNNSPNLQMAYFTDAEASSNETQFNSLENPYYFAMAAATNAEARTKSALESGEDPGVVTSARGASVFVLFCGSTIYDIQYSLVNNTIARFESRKSNSTLANIIQGAQHYSPQAGYQILNQQASVSVTQDNIEGLERDMALAYSRVALSMAVAAFDPSAPIEKQSRETSLVARVPKAPLAALLLGNLLMALLGVVLTVIALVAVHGNNDIREVQARLGISGLVADRFEGDAARVPVETVEDLFVEKSGRKDARVGIMRSNEGGYSWGAWNPIQ